MATVAAIQAQLDASGSGMSANIMQSAYVSASLDEHLVVALASTSATPGTARWVRTTSAQTAAQQATAILAGLTV